MHTENTEALRGTTALVTGASRGIGATVARVLAALGVRVALTARSVETLRALADEIDGDAVVAPCDLTDVTAIQRMVSDVQRAFGGAPDVIVNNAGIFRLALLETMTPELFADTVQANLIAPFLVIRAFLPAMRERGRGHIVTIGSIADRNIFPENGAYASAKYGLRAMHEVLRTEMRGSGVRATLISPGPVDTSIWDDVLTQDHTRQLPTRNMMLSPTAVADAIVYAVSQPSHTNIDELRLSRS